MSSKQIKITLASPRGFCAGVERAIETVKMALKEHGSPVYVLHEIVHNKHVIANLRRGGAVFVESLDQIPKGEVCIFSAHGISVDTEIQAENLGLRTIDATCPLVSSVHWMVERYSKENCSIVIIGHHKHPEVEGTAGRVPENVYILATAQEAEELQLPADKPVAFVTQTTLAKNDIEQVLSVLKKRFPDLRGPTSNICFATQNRQDAVRQLAKESDVILVVGSKNSSNSNRLKEVGIEYGVEAFLVDDYRDIDIKWFENASRIGITAGASAPESLVEGVVGWLSKKFDDCEVHEMEGTLEEVHFKPATLFD